MALAGLATIAAGPAFAQAGLPGPRVDVGADVVATASPTASGVTWSPRVTFNPSPDLGVVFRASDFTSRDRLEYGRRVTTIEMDVRRLLAYANGAVVYGIAGTGLRRRRDLTSDYGFDRAAGHLRVVSPHVDEYSLMGVVGVGVAERLGTSVELRQDVTATAHGDGLDLAVTAGVAIPIGRYVTRAGGQSARIGSYRLLTGQRVWITEHDGTTVEGHVGDVSPVSIEVIRRSGRSRVDVARVQRIAVPDPIRDGVKRGALIGGLGFGVYGALIARAICECSEWGDAVMITMTLAGFGAGGGALVGAVADGFRVVPKPVFERTPRAVVAIPVATIRW